MKKLVLIFISLISIVTASNFLILRAQEKLETKNSIDEVLKQNPLYYSKNGKTYKKSSLNQSSIEVFPKSGTVSLDGTLFAYINIDPYTKRSESSIHIYNINLKKEETLNLNDDGINKSIVSWSPDGSKILLVSSSQSLGTIKAYLFSLRDSKIIQTLNFYDYNYLWVDASSLLYFKLDDCLKNCVYSNVSLNKFNIDSLINEKQELFYDLKGGFPIIKNISFYEGKLQISQSNYTQIESDDIPIKYEKVDYYNEFDFESKKLSPIDLNNSMELRISKEIFGKINENYKVSINNNLGNNYYLVTLYPLIEGIEIQKYIFQLEGGNIKGFYNFNI